MNDFLQSNQKNEIRAKISEDIILYEPNEEQLIELQNILKDNLNVDENLNASGEISYKYIRWIIRNLCKNGAFIDEYSDEELEELLNNGNRNIKRLINEITNLLNEIGEDILIEQSQLIDTFSKTANLLNTNVELANMENKFNKLFKKQGYDVNFSDVLSGKITPEMLENKKIKPKNKKK